MKNTYYLLFALLIVFSCTTTTHDDNTSTTEAIPVAPTNLTGTVQSTTQINLSWTDNSTNETGFKIERRTGIENYAIVGTVNADVLTFSDIGLTPSTAYIYRVYSYNTAGNSPTYSNEQTLTTSNPIILPNVTISQDDVKSEIDLQSMSEDINTVISQTLRNIAPLLQNQPITQSCPILTRDMSVNFPSIKIKYDYGTGCTNNDGKFFKGIVFVTITNYTYDPINNTLGNYTLNCEFQNLANLKYQLNGTSIIKKVNTVWTIDFDHTAIALATNKSYKRKGTQIREFIQGYSTADTNDDRFKTTGNWVTTTENGEHIVTITTPFITDYSCAPNANVTEGIMKIVKSTSIATLDYGYKRDGINACDNWCQLTINSLSPLYLQFER